MTEKRLLTSEEITAIVDGYDSIDIEEVEMIANCHQASVGLSPIEKPKRFAPIFATNSGKIFPNSHCLKSI